jgi:hypothetical protein
MADPADGAREAVGIKVSDRVAIEAQEKAGEIRAELAQRREILDADQLAGLIAPKARHERSFDHLQAHFFSIDGVLNGRKIQGALFAGECILTYGVTLAHAEDLANRGLRATVDLLHEEYATRDVRVDDPVTKGIVQEAGGRRHRGEVNTPQMKKLEAMMRHRIAGLPWVW